MKGSISALPPFQPRERRRPWQPLWATDSQPGDRQAFAIDVPELRQSGATAPAGASTYPTCVRDPVLNKTGKWDTVNERANMINHGEPPFHLERLAIINFLFGAETDRARNVVPGLAFVDAGAVKCGFR